MQLLLERLLPIFLIILAGILLRKTGILEQNAANGLKSIILKLGLPAVLFSSFAQTKMEQTYIIIFVVVFIMCIMLYGVGHLLGKVYPRTFDSSTDAYFTGFEFGMVGIGLFTALWGVEKLPVILLIGFGHELFIWFVYVPLLEYKKTGKISIYRTIVTFLRSPIIIAILGGMLVNLLGLYPIIQGNLAGRGFLNALSMVAPIVSPLILVVIGHAMTFKAIPIKRAFFYVLGRWFNVTIIGGVALLLLLFLVPNRDPLFVKAFIAFLLLPPPYILPLFFKQEDVAKQSFYSELLIYHTLTSFAGFIVLMLVR